MIVRWWPFGAAKRRDAPTTDRPGGMRRLFVDLSTIAQRDAGTGIQRVVRALWAQLDRAQLQDYVVIPVAATARRGYRIVPLADGEITLPEDGAPLIEMCAGDIFLGLDLAAHRLWRHRRQVRRWKRRGATIAITVYDLLPLRQPAWFPSSTVRNFKRWIRILDRYGDIALCISRHVADDLAQQMETRWWGGRSKLVRTLLPMSGDVAGSRPSEGMRPVDIAVLQAIDQRPTVLMVGTVEPRKGQDILLDAFEWLWAEMGTDAPMLAIVGRPGWRTDALQRRLTTHAARGTSLHWLDAASDEALTALYARASMVVVPSRGEGFGLPVIEALGQGRKVLARDLPVFRELERDGLYYFASEAPEPLGQAILETLAQPEPAIRTSDDDWSRSLAALLAALGIDRRASQ